MPALQREAAGAEKRLSGDLQQSVPQNGRVHLHIIDVWCALHFAATVLAKQLTSQLSLLMQLRPENPPDPTR